MHEGYVSFSVSQPTGNISFARDMGDYLWKGIGYMFGDLVPKRVHEPKSQSILDSKDHAIYPVRRIIVSIVLSWLAHEELIRL